jgi:hypothetical protein
MQNFGEAEYASSLRDAVGFCLAAIGGPPDRNNTPKPEVEIAQTDAGTLTRAVSR